MPCYRPLVGYRRARTEKWSALEQRVVHQGGGWTARRAESWQEYMPLTVPCGKCIGCRIEYSRQWAVRCAHEAQLHEENSFWTLTYADHRLPADRSVHLRELQLFFKRLRKWCESNREGWINDDGKRSYFRYFACGEYGDLTQRPHYHAIVFGVDMQDKQLLKLNKQKQPLYKSEEALNIWSDEDGPIGHVTLGAVSFQSAAYVARYIMKKQTGDQAEAHYNGRRSEFVTASKKPGLGRKWIERYYGDVYPHDVFHLEGKPHRPPRFYDEVYRGIDPKGFADLKARRIREGRASEDHPSRLAVKEQVKEARLRMLVRPHE